MQPPTCASTQAGAFGITLSLCMCASTGLLVPDIPLEETEGIRAMCNKHGLELVLLTTPTTPQVCNVMHARARARTCVCVCVCPAHNTHNTTGENASMRLCVCVCVCVCVFVSACVHT